MKKNFLPELSPKSLLVPMFLVLFILVASTAIANGSHGDKGLITNNNKESGLFHYGGLSFPVWTYYAEILEHIAMFVTVAIILAYLISWRNKDITKNLDYIIIGFASLAAAEALTTLHHFLLHLFGTFNAVITHALTLIGFIFLAYGLFMLLKRGNAQQI